jgi:hypothetical protein
MKTVTIPGVIRTQKLKCSNVLLVYIDYMNIAKPVYIRPVKPVLFFVKNRGDISTAIAHRYDCAFCE